jgi:hypothetical protein
VREHDSDHCGDNPACGGDEDKQELKRMFAPGAPVLRLVPGVRAFT